MADVVCFPVSRCGAFLKATILAWRGASGRSLPNEDQDVADEEHCSEDPAHHRITRQRCQRRSSVSVSGLGRGAAATVKRRSMEFVRRRRLLVQVDGQRWLNRVKTAV